MSKQVLDHARIGAGGAVFALPIKPDKIDEYRKTHANVWPELLAENTTAGIRNYTIVLFGHHAIGFLECDDWEAATERLGKSDAQPHLMEALKRGEVSDLTTTPGAMEIVSQNSQIVRQAGITSTPTTIYQDADGTPRIRRGALTAEQIRSL